ncbi:MAG TPA: CheR family methyltransferase [Solirubrobacteraceae bacterium]|nr:CheR family methyltransferase [Solirubrobacteraceae bacterium]
MTEDRSPKPEPQDAPFEALLAYLKASRGFDFTGYKRTSLERRIRKRMQEVGVADFGDYLDYLEVQQDEFPALFDTILINVTGFFRDPPAWDFLVDQIIPRLLEEVDDADPIRVWCAGCASGEETYTMAMVLAEALGEEAYMRRVKVYATEVDEDALNHARLGTYTAKQVEAVPPKLLDRYFQRIDSRYSINKEMRRTVIFGRNDLTQDAPISHIDLLTCRNTLMYFNAETQARILNRFHFALNPWGYLFLGKSEMLNTHSDVFRPVNLRRRVFSKVSKATLRDRLVMFPDVGETLAGAPAADLREAAYDASPAAQIVVDADGALVFANARARSLFRLSQSDVGRPLKDLELSYRPVELRSILDSACAERRAVSVPDVAVTSPTGQRRDVEVHITPLRSGQRHQGASIVYEDVTREKRAQEELATTKRDLEAAYEELQSTVEELETTNEELQSTNEELETTNEELQSANEELETMNEELQSTNEELETINDELRQRSLELNDVNAFLETILGRMGLAVIVVDRDETVQVWNSESAELWGVRSDEATGRRLRSLDIGLPLDGVGSALERVLDGSEERAEVVLEATNRRGRPVKVRVTCLPLGSPSGATGAVMLTSAVDHRGGPDGPRVS